MMFTYGRQTQQNCGGVSRRSLLQAGGTSLLGMSLPRLLAAESTQAVAARKPMNCIILWMGGGPSNIDLFDMKPQAPIEYRGEFRPISSNVAGIDVCEHLPLMSKRMDKVCVVRSVSHKESGDHTAASHYMLTGYPQVPEPSGQPAGALVYQAIGSVVNSELGWQNSLPPYVILGAEWSPYSLSGYMGTAYDPLTVKADPNDPKFTVEDLTITEAIGSPRTNRRRTMLQSLDQWQRRMDKKSGPVLERSRFHQQAYDLMTSAAAKEAFRIDQEPDAVRDRYGRNVYGQTCLLARRLVEAGVRLVMMSTGQWDTHVNNFGGMKEAIRLPYLDQYWSALLDDLEQRGLLDNTLVLWLGEFGRTPTVNNAAGRDHWAPTSTICMSGGGINMGSIVGATDSRCMYPLGTPHSSHDFAATVFRLMGIDATREYLTPDGRPVLISYHGTPIAEALA